MTSGRHIMESAVVAGKATVGSVEYVESDKDILVSVLCYDT